MTSDETRPLSRLVDCFLSETKDSAYLRYNPPEGGTTQYIEFPIEDLARLADMAALTLRETMPRTSEDNLALIAHSFDLAEARDIDAISVAFRLARDSELRVALPKPLAERLNASMTQLLPLIGGSKARN